MASHDQVNDELNYDFDARTNPYFQDQTWSIPIDQMESIAADVRRNVSPIQTDMAGLRQTAMPEHPMMDNWIFQQMQQQQQQQEQQQRRQQYQHQHQHQQQQQQQAQHIQQQQQQEQENHLQQQIQEQDQHIQQQIQAQLDYEQSPHGLEMSYNPYSMTLPQQMTIVAHTPPNMNASIPVEQTFVAMTGAIEALPADWSNLDAELVFSTTTDNGMVPVSPYHQQTHSPTGSHVETMSQPSSAEENGWIMADRLSFEMADRPIFVDPNQTLHDCSQAVYSPGNLSSDSDYEHLQPCHTHNIADSQMIVTRPVHPTPFVRPIAIPSPSKSSSPPARSPASAGSAGSPGRSKALKKGPIAPKTADNRVSKKSVAFEKSSEKRVGKRKGPLKPEQRKQASEIRKLRACLRCKFLKKTCDPGDPCSGCQPSHARLWQVPCTRIDIKDIGYFLKDRKFDYERHVSLGFSLANLMGFSDKETTLHITHGYGHMLPINAREVYVRNDDCLKMDWREANRDPNGYEVATAKLSAGADGISTTMLSDYLDRHIDCDGTFENFVDDYFEGTQFLSEMLKVAFRFYLRTNSKVIKKALKLMLAYNLTLHITMVEGRPIEEDFIGKVEDESSRFYGKTIAPVMINFQIKVAMSDMWRELHKDVLEELSSLYSSVYSGDKLKNWPTIFILASILLAVWECMQFDCHYRVPDEASVNKFCADMETTPVGVIVGLFSAISQKLPSILEWDTSKHHFLLASNPEVCQTMTEVREHVTVHESYLRDRPSAKFDRQNFDSLSNKFLSRLVLRDIRAN